MWSAEERAEGLEYMHPKPSSHSGRIVGNPSLTRLGKVCPSSDHNRQQPLNGAFRLLEPVSLHMKRTKEGLAERRPLRSKRTGGCAASHPLDYRSVGTIAYVVLA